MTSHFADVAGAEIEPGYAKERGQGGTSPGGLDPAGSRSVSEGERTAILDSLHKERRALARAQLMGTLSASDAEYLEDLERYIDRWELQERAETSDSDEIWHKLREVAAQVLSLQAAVERTRR